MKIEMRKASDLIPYHNNPRINDGAVNHVASSIKEFGFKVPIVIDAFNVIVTGHTRLKAAQKLGLEEVPCIQADDLTPAQIKAFRIADNKTAEFSVWDYPLLNMELDELKELDFDYDFGFDDDELFTPDKEGFTDEDAIPEEVEPICQTGDLWQLGEHRLLCGDATKKEDVERLMGGDKADMVITSPPYWNQREYSHWDKFEDYINDMSLVVTNSPIISNTIIFWNIGDDSANHQHISAKHSIMLENCGLIYIDAIIWKKQGVTGIRLSHQKTKNLYYPGFSFENCLVFQKDNTSFPIFEEKYKNEIPISNVWDISTDPNRGKNHSAPFPVKLPETAIKCYSNKDSNKIYDPFIGGGTTLIACEKTNRKCFGMEIDQHYCDVIIKRWEDFTGKKAEKL